MLLPVEGDAGLAHHAQIFQELVDPRESMGRAPLVSAPDQRLDRIVIEMGEIGFPVRRAVERKCLANG
jgi:hypothetical protein